MRNIVGIQHGDEQKRITILFCFVIAVAIICSVMFCTINAQAAPAENINKYYTSVRVECGDTLWAIAGEYITDDYIDMNDFLNEICMINHISEDEIHAGQYIIVPYYTVDVSSVQ